MGNFSSCTSTGFKSSAEPASSSPLARTPSHVARVLLIDGGMLKFRAPIKARKLLLDYPNHHICPLDSLKPGLHSLSSLLPDEKLQLGRLYLLLPFKGNMQEGSCIKNKQVVQQKQDQFLTMQEREEHTMLLRGSKSNVGLASCASLYKKGDVGPNDHNKLQSSSLVQEDQHISKQKAGSRDIGKWQQKNRVNMIKSEVGFQECAEGRKNGDVGRSTATLRSSSISSSNGGGKLSDHKSRRGRREMRRINSGKESNVVSPLCDTPELQRAYRSLLLRSRSSSWTPRLPPILERR